MRIGILTGGGDVPGLNPCIRSITLNADDLGWEVTGFRRGWEGVLAIDPADPRTVEANTLPLSREGVRGIDRMGGTILHTSRLDPRTVKSGDRTDHVLQVLDKRGSPTFSLHDMELLAVFAGQATVAIGAARVQRDTDRLLRSVLTQVGPSFSEDDVERLVRAATNALDVDDESPFWRLVDQVARLRAMTDRETALVTDILEVVAAHAGRARRPRAGR